MTQTRQLSILKLDSAMEYERFWPLGTTLWFRPRSQYWWNCRRPPSTRFKLECFLLISAEISFKGSTHWLVQKHLLLYKKNNKIKGTKLMGLKPIRSVDGKGCEPMQICGSSHRRKKVGGRALGGTVGQTFRWLWTDRSPRHQTVPNYYISHIGNW